MLQSFLEGKISPDPNTGCWLWLGDVNSSGYPYARINGQKRVLIHRYVIGCPEGLEAMHLCHTPLCVNPDHLKAGTHRENCNDPKTIERTAQAQRKDICKWGHPLDGRKIGRRGAVWKYCKTCNKLRCAQYKARLR